MATFQIIDFASIQRRIRNELKVDPNDQSNVNRIQEIVNEIYLQEVVPHKRWLWLSGAADVQLPPFISNGTASVTPLSATVTLTVAPAASQKNNYFAIDGFSEIYTISAHTAGSTTVTLSQPYAGSLGAALTYKIWTDSIALPNDCREVISVWHEFMNEPMEPLGLQAYRKRMNESPRLADRPRVFHDYDFFNPGNGAEIDSTRYRLLKVWPAVATYTTTMHVDYTKKATPLSLDGDEPLMPVDDRIILVYGALSIAWASINRNPEEAARNEALYKQKLSHMAGRLETGNDSPRLQPDSEYLKRKRGVTGRMGNYAGVTAGGSSYSAPSYLSNVTIAGANIIANVTVANGIKIAGRLMTTDGATLDSLNSLGSGQIFVGNNSNVTSKVAMTGDVTISNAGATTVGLVGGSTAVNVHNAELLANAATNANTVSTIVKRDSSGNFAAGTVTAGLTGNVTGNLTGNVTGNVTGALTGPVTGNVAGNLTGNVTGNVTGNLSGNVKTTGGSTVLDTTAGILYNTVGTVSVHMNNQQLWSSNTNVCADFSQPTFQVNSGLKILGKDGANAVTILASQSLTGSTQYSLEYPIAQGGANQTLINSGAGVYTWTTPLQASNNLSDVTTKATAFNNISPMTTGGDLIYGAAAGAATRLPNGTFGQVLQSSGGTSAPVWTNPATGTKNYISLGNFENNATTGWSLGTVGTLTNAIPTGTPTFGSGASVNLSVATVSSGQLAGTYSLSLASSAATTVGNMLATQTYTIDLEDQAKVLTWKFYYSAVSGTANCNFSGTSSNSFGVAVYDVTNSVWLSSTANFGMTQGTGVGIATGTFQTGATTASLRFVVYNANATTGATTVYFDDFFVGPQTAPIGVVETDLVAYTPTITGFGTPTGVSFFSRRIGSNLEVFGQFTSGTSTAVQAQITLGFNGANANVTSNAALLPVGTTGALIGTATTSQASTTFFGIGPISAVTNQNYFNLGTQTSATGIFNATNGNTIANAGNIVNVYIMVPIVGWSSNVQMSNDTDTRVVAMAASGTPTGTVSGSYNTVTWPTTDRDTHGGYSSGTYTVPVSGYYDVAAQVMVTGTSATYVLLGIHINGTLKYAGAWRSVTAMTGDQVVPVSAKSIYLNAGDLVTIKTNTNGTTASLVATFGGINYFTISRQSGPSVIAATESISLSAAKAASGTLLNATEAVFVYDTVNKDSHGTYNSSTGLYTVPVSGDYYLYATAEFNTSTGGRRDMYVQKNGTQLTILARVNPSNLVPDVASGGALITGLKAGDTLAVSVFQNSGASLTVNPDGVSRNYLSIFRMR